VAFKVMRKSKLVDVGEVQHACCERKLHEKLSKGSYINKLLASFQTPWALFLILEYAPCGDLFQAMNYHGLPSQRDAALYAAQVALALKYIHFCNYVYRDLKPENILLKADGSAQLADFGMAKLLKDGERTYTICGTAQYMSPEVLLHRGCYFEADLWAMGIFIYELTCGDTPFSTANGTRQDMYRKLMNHVPETMTFTRQFDRRATSIIKGLLQNDETKRLGSGKNFDQLFMHPWFDDIDVQAVVDGTIVQTLKPRKRNVVNDPQLQQQLQKNDFPWEKGNLVEDEETLNLFKDF